MKFATTLTQEEVERADSAFEEQGLRHQIKRGATVIINCATGEAVIEDSGDNVRAMKRFIERFGTNVRGMLFCRDVVHIGYPFGVIDG